MTCQISDKPHVVIVGAGFGGLAAAKALKNAPVRVTVIDRANHHLFQPLLYQVAMAGLSPAEIAYPIRSILRKQPNTNVLLAEVTGIDLANRLVKSTAGAINYDYLVLAAGAQTNYYNHPEWAEHAIGLKDVDDAEEIRRRVLLAFEQAEREKDPEVRRKLLTFVVIGGGSTGVELAGSLAELARHALAKDFKCINPSSAKVLILEGFNRILPAFTEDLSASAVFQLERLGVQVVTGVKVKNVDSSGIHLEGGGLLPSSTVLWCAGIAPSPLTRDLGVALDRTGRILAEADLSVTGHPEVFAIGDICSFLHQDGKPLPGLAPVAMQQGRAVSQSIIADLAGKPRRKFVYKHRGSLATIGRKAAVADFGKLKLSGLPAWLSWLFVHIMFLIGFRNRVVVMLDWMWMHLTYQRGARLITGRRLDAGPPKKNSAG